MAVLELGVFGAFIASLGLTPTSIIIYFPFIFMNIFILVFGTSLALGALNTYYRDIQYIWAVILQASFFASGIFINFSTYQGELKNLLLLNPMAIIILISRESLLYNTAVSSSDLIYCLASSLMMLVIGYLIFINLEPGFAEEV